MVWKFHWTELENANEHQARRVMDKDNQCLLNLLVKHHWGLFVLAEPFHYRVHAGIDVGAVSANVMIGIGHGFEPSTKQLLFYL